MRWHEALRPDAPRARGEGRPALVRLLYARRAGRQGGIAHFGFRLAKPVPLATIVRRVKAAGGKVRSKGEFAPGRTAEPQVGGLIVPAHHEGEEK
jgi:hypothetical protein